VEKSFEISESLRRQVSSILFGDVEEVLEGGWCRVRTDDGCLTAPMPPLRPNGSSGGFYLALSIGEQVVILAPNGDLSMGVILGSIPRREKSSEIPLTEGRWSFSDGSQISYDTKSKVLKVKSEGTISIEASGEEIKLKASKVKIDASILEVSGDVTANGVSLQTHTHVGVKAGPDLSGPPQK